MGQNLASKQQCFQPYLVNQTSHDQRAEPRVLLLIRAAKVIINGNYEVPCVIRDASSMGLKIRLFNSLPDELRTVSVELSNGACYPVDVIWQDVGYAGLRFVQPIDLGRFLAEDEDPYQKREVRLRTQICATVHTSSYAAQVTFQDISQKGASIECQKWLLVDELVRVKSSSLPETYAKVRWRSHPHYGLLFENIFRLDELAGIVGLKLI